MKGLHQNKSSHNCCLQNCTCTTTTFSHHSQDKKVEVLVAEEERDIDVAAFMRFTQFSFIS